MEVERCQLTIRVREPGAMMRIREWSWTPGRQLSITDITVSNQRIRAVDTDLKVVDEQSEVARVRWRGVPPSEL